MLNKLIKAAVNEISKRYKHVMVSGISNDNSKKVIFSVKSSKGSVVGDIDYAVIYKKSYPQEFLIDALEQLVKKVM